MASQATLSKVFAGLAVIGLLVGSASAFFMGPSGKPTAKAPITTPSATKTVLPTTKVPTSTPTSTPKPSKSPKTVPPASPSAKPSTSKPSSKPSTVKPSPKKTTPKPVVPSTPRTSTPAVPAPTATPKPTPTTPKPSPTPTQSQVTQVYALINQERQKRGLGIIYRTDRLEASAQSWSVQMANDGYMRHTNPLPPGVYGECVARGYSTATAVMTAWMNSTGHRNIILGNYSQVGVGYVANGGWWTLQFA